VIQPCEHMCACASTGLEDSECVSEVQ